MIYDFYEILGRGIIAARTGRNEDALKFLSLAAKIEPSNPRVWMWLATASKSVASKRKYLQEALAIDPNLLAASVLLDRLDRSQNISSGQNPKLEIFTCPSCGGKQRFDPDISGMQCEYCGKVESLALENASDQESRLDGRIQKESGNWSFIEAHAVCGACGARISHPPSQTTIRCPFCNSDMVTAQSATPNLVSPTGIVPFRCHREDVLDIFAKRWEIPKRNLLQLINVREITLSPIYLPFWTFDATVQILCALEYRVEPVIYSPEERVILKGEWPIEKSWFECDIDDLLVYAARSVPNDSIMAVFPFDPQSVLEYRPEILAGWQAETYQLALADAAVESHKRMRDHAFERAMKRRLFMQPSRMLQSDVIVLDKTYKLILLPVWIVNRTNSKDVSQTIVNGQTGKVSEEESDVLSSQA